MINKYKKEDAKQFSEGNKILEEILLQCWEKGIKIEYCCAGHYVKDFDALKEKYKENEALWSTALEKYEKNGIIKNESPYLCVMGLSSNENFAHYINNFLFNDNVVIDNCGTNCIYFDVPYQFKIFEERNEEEFDSKTNQFYNSLLELIKGYNPDKEYHSPYVEIIKLIKRVQKGDDAFNVYGNNNRLYIQTQTKLNLIGFDFKDNGEKSFIRYAYRTDDKSLVNKTIESLKEQSKTNKYTKEDAKAFSEGNKILEEVLLQCWEKGIDTIHCCAGHFIKDFETLKERYSVYELEWPTVLEDYEKNKTLQNVSPYFSIYGLEANENFIHYVLNENVDTGNKGTSFLSFYLPSQLAVGKERNEEEFYKKINAFYSAVLEIIKGYNPDKEYYSPYVEIIKLVKHIQKGNNVFFVTKANQKLSIQTETKLHLNNFEFMDYGEGFRPRYLYKTENLSLINEAIDSLKKELNKDNTNNKISE